MENNRRNKTNQFLFYFNAFPSPITMQRFNAILLHNCFVCYESDLKSFQLFQYRLIALRIYTTLGTKHNINSTMTVKDSSLDSPVLDYNVQDNGHSPRVYVLVLSTRHLYCKGSENKMATSTIMIT